MHQKISGNLDFDLFVVNTEAIQLTFQTQVKNKKIYPKKFLTFSEKKILYFGMDAVQTQNSYTPPWMLTPLWDGC